MPCRVTQLLLRPNIQREPTQTSVRIHKDCISRKVPAICTNFKISPNSLKLSVKCRSLVSKLYLDILAPLTVTRELWLRFFRTVRARLYQGSVKSWGGFWQTRTFTSCSTYLHVNAISLHLDLLNRQKRALGLPFSEKMQITPIVRRSPNNRHTTVDIWD